MSAPRYVAMFFTDAAADKILFRLPVQMLRRIRYHARR